MAVTAARQIAFEVLRRVAAEDAYAADLLHARLAKSRGRHAGKATRADAALVTELTLGALRWQRWLDFWIEKQTGKPITSLDLEVLLALRLGLYQLRFLTRVPARAAVHESVELVKWARKGSAGGLVNAVLRCVPETPLEELLPPDLPPAERLGILHSHPTWLVERWLGRFGEARTVALLEANNRAPRLCCTVQEPAQLESILASLSESGLQVQAGRWLRSTLAIRGGALSETRAFRRGWISIQDEASQMIPLLLEVREGQRVLDLCAAPGGKTFALARAAGPHGQVIAADRHLRRLGAMRQQLTRLRASRVHLLALDAATSLPFEHPFDCILLDAPCSGTGTLARNPEIRWRLRPQDLEEFHRRQVTLLENALERLAPGGRLVYSTCSLEPEENQQVVARALAGKKDLQLAEAAPALAPHLVSSGAAHALFTGDGFFRTFPPEHETDGFFAAVIERKL